MDDRPSSGPCIDDFVGEERIEEGRKATAAGCVKDGGRRLDELLLDSSVDAAARAAIERMICIL